MFSNRQVRQSTASVPARGTIQLLLARGFFLASGYIIAVILARGLGPTEYGVYGVIMSVLVWIEVTARAGIPSAATKLIPQHQDKALAVEQSAQISLVLLSIALFVLCWILAPTLARLFKLPYAVTLFRLAILDLPVSGMYFAYEGILGGYRRFGQLSASMIAYSMTKVVGILGLYLLGLSVAGALIVNVLATVGALVYLVAKAPPQIAWPTWPLMREMLWIALPIALYLITSQVILNFDLWSLQVLGANSQGAVGIYVAALNLARVLVVVPAVLSGVVFSSLSWALANKNEALAQRYIQSASRFACTVIFPVCVLLAVHAKPIMELLYGGSYTAGGVFLVLQLVGVSCRTILDLCLVSLMAAGKYYLCLGLTLALLPIAFMSNLELIPQYGALGAAMALVIVLFLGATIAVVAASLRFGALIKATSLIRIAAAAAFIGFLGNQISFDGLALLFKLAGLMAVYVLLLSIFRELRWGDLKAFALWENTTP
jgi:O-antigen/teichoic acid export membrane protein